jgi:hypothetical protein
LLVAGRGKILVEALAGDSAECGAACFNADSGETKGV